jgi:hypothetical protein
MNRFVDFELRGCPVNKYQLVEVVTALLNGRQPQIPTYSVCLECKRAATPCVMVSRGAFCLGPITQAGCGAICSKFHRGCYGCFGPAETPNIESLAEHFRKQGLGSAEITRMLRSFSGYLAHFEESQVEHSNALQGRLRGGGSYLVGPLARLNLNWDLYPDPIKELAREIGFQPPCHNPFKSIIARGLETLYALDHAVEIIEGYERPEAPAALITRREGKGHGCTEAPRGILYHPRTWFDRSDPMSSPC